MPSPRATAVARTLTEALRHTGREQLVELLRLRPDLGYPHPRNLGELVQQATTNASVVRCLDGLNAWQLQVAEGLAALPDPAAVDDLAELLSAAGGAVASAVGDLRARALLWGTDDAVHLVRGVRDQFGGYPGGLAPPSARPLTSGEIDRLITECDPAARAVLDRLLWAPTGTVAGADRVVDPATARTPVEQLLARRLLRPVTGDTVILPREVALHLRSGRFSRDPVAPVPSPVPSAPTDPVRVDHAAVGAAFELLHDIELAAQSVEATPHRLLRDGGVSSRDTALLAASLGTDAAHAVFVLECAVAAGVLGVGDRHRLLPTTAYDRWAHADAPIRWRTVAESWLRLARLPFRASEPGAHALGPESEARHAPTARALLLRLAVEAGTGAVPELDALGKALAWHRPVLGTIAGVPLSVVVQRTWQEASWLGLAGLGAPSSLAAALLLPDRPLPAAVADLFPEPVHRVIIQSDLTAVVPGPLPYALSTELRLLADQESRGHGAVFRFSAASLRRAYDAGWSAAEVRDWLDRHSSTGVPQPLAYLVEDAARRHGTLRVGPARSYVHVPDQAQVAALLAHPDAAVLGFRAVGPGVLVASGEVYEVVDALRTAGQSPTVEDAEGRQVTAPPPARARPTPASATPPGADPGQVADLLLSPEPEPAPEPLRRTLDELAEATREARPVRVSYVAADGQAAERELSLLDLAAGHIRGVDPRSAQVVSIPLARVKSVSSAD